MAEKRTEWRGVRNLVCAEIITDDKDNFVTGEVFGIAGVAEISKTRESSNESHYYDDVPAINVASDGPDEITISVSAIPLEVLARITGQKYIDGVFIECKREPKYFAIGYIAKRTDGTEVYVWRLKGSFAIPDVTHITENDGTDANGQELTYTGIETEHVFEKIGCSARANTVELAISNYDVSTFFEEVTTIDMLQVKGE